MFPAFEEWGLRIVLTEMTVIGRLLRFPSATLLLLGTGLVGLAGWRMRRRAA